MVRPHRPDSFETIFHFGPFRVDAGERALCREGRQIPLAPKEFETLLALLESGGHLVEKETLIARIWPDSYVGDGSLARNISVLRKVLGEDVIQTVPKIGYRLAVVPAIGPVSPEPTKGNREPQQVEEPQAPIPRHKRRAVIAVSALLLIVSIGSFLGSLFRHSKQVDAHRPALVRIAVLPFQNMTGNEGDEYLCDGLTEAMISELSRLDPGSLSVIARTSSMHYRRTSKTISTIGKELSVDYLLESSLRGAGDRLHITTQLIRVSDATHLWTGEYERGLQDVVQLQEQIAIGIAGEIQLKLAPATAARLGKGHQINAVAYRNYLLGRYQLNKRTRDGILKAHNYFQQALTIDPDYAPAHAGAADTYIQEAIWGISSNRDGYRMGVASAQKALTIDAESSEAYAALGLADYLYEWNWKEAEDNFLKAIRLDPNFAAAHARYAYFLAAFKRHDEAVREIKRALELDPLSVGTSQNAGFIYAQAGRYVESVIQLQQALQLDEQNQVTHGYLAITYEWQGDYDRALNEFQTAQKVSGRYVPYAAGIGHVLAMKGRRSEARDIMKKLAESGRREPVSPYSFAAIHAALGEKDEAFKFLQDAVNDRSCTVTELNNDHALDPLRSDPRFQQLRRQLKLE
jgi:TolB-like protein/DNA-binding winged helix-turn-helix (wHTH) protein/Tfp pilus assembly protein PilF